MGTRGNGSLFVVRHGNCAGGTVSFEASDKPGAFLRHRNGVLELDARDGSSLFDSDSSFVVAPSLDSGSTQKVSLAASNIHGFIRQQNSVLRISDFEETDLFVADATFVPMEAQTVSMAVV